MLLLKCLIIFNCNESIRFCCTVQLYIYYIEIIPILPELRYVLPFFYCQKIMYNHFLKYRVIHKSLRDFRTRLRNNQDRHGRKEHINR